MSLETISFNNITIKKKYYSYVHGDIDVNIQGMVIAEYDIKEALNNVPRGICYFPKKIYIRIIDHIVSFMKTFQRVMFLRKTKFSFSLKRSYSRYYRYRAITPDIVFEWVINETTDITANREILNIINNMDDIVLGPDEGVNVTDPKLVIVGIEIIDSPGSIILKNGGKSFKTEECVICMDKKPNVIFCNCGHICMCNTCRTSLDDKNKCIVCKTVCTLVIEI